MPDFYYFCKPINNQAPQSNTFYRIYMTLLRTIIILLTLIPAIGINAASPWQTRFHDEDADTAAITALLNEVAAVDGLDASGRISLFAHKLAGKPYVANTIEGTPEQLTVNMAEFDCTTFVETVMALAMTLESGRNSWMDFLYNLEKIRYRGGHVNGYGSRLHYISDWIIDNAHRGNFEEVTSKIGHPSYIVKTIDFMSTHRDKYPALADDAEYQTIKNMEVGYRSHRFPVIKPHDLKRAQLREGDVVAMATNIKGLDTQHIGIVTMTGGVPHLLHASSKAGKVIIDPLPLSEYLRKNRSIVGIRVIRLKD